MAIVSNGSYWRSVGAGATLMTVATLLAPGLAFATDLTVGLERCDSSMIVTTPSTSRYLVDSQTLDLPMIFVPGAGWYRASLQVAPGSNYGFALKELATSCQQQTEPAAYIPSTQTLLVPSLEVASSTGQVSKFDLKLRLQPDTGHFVPIDLWETGSDSTVPISQSKPRAAAATVEAVQLDVAVGLYPAGSIVPLTRIRGTRIGNPESGCDSRHLHGGPAYFDNVGPYSDPNPSGCGYGKVVSVQSDTIDYGVINASVPTGTDYCGPDITSVFFSRLKLMATRLTALPDSERGMFDGTVFLARNGVNMDFVTGGLRDPTGSPVCPTAKCSGIGHTSTFTLCGQCMISHVDNDIEYGFVAKMLGVPMSVQLAGGHAWDFWQRAGLDPLPSQMAYQAGNNLASTLKAAPAATDTQLCAALTGSRLRTGIVTLRTSTSMFSEEMGAFGKSSCVPCPHGCPAELVQKDFSTQPWNLDNGAISNYTP